jgi:DNA-binding NtrC family response regulator
MKQQKIMIVDDEVDFLASMKRAFRREPYDLITALNGKSALELFKNREVDLVISDYKMPEMDGLTLLKNISIVAPQIPTIMLTAVRDIDITLKAVNDVGTYNFFLKPIDIVYLKSAIKKIFSNKENFRKKPDGVLQVLPVKETSPRYDNEESHVPSWYYQTTVAECPFCKTGVGLRIRRKKWMRLIRVMVHYQCCHCRGTFTKLSLQG